MAENGDSSGAHNDLIPEGELLKDDEMPQKTHEEGRATEPPSRSAQKKLLKLQRYEAKKAHQKAMTKQKKQKEIERKRQEWADKLASLSVEERSNLIQAKLDTRKERMGQRLEEREHTKERLKNAMQCGQNIVVDLEFCELMNPNELSSLVQQIMYCYAANRKSASPAHLWLTGCKGEIKSRLQKVPGFDNWLVEKEERSYVKALEERREDLVYLTADSEDVLQELEASKIYVIGGLVDRNRWKGITMQKAKEQGIQTAKLPIADHLKMSSSQVLTVNQVTEILVTFLECKDWRKALLQVIPPRKRSEVDSNDETSGRKKKSHISETVREEIAAIVHDPHAGSICDERGEEVN